jgi:hypothetical protein
MLSFHDALVRQYLSIVQYQVPAGSIDLVLHVTKLDRFESNPIRHPLVGHWMPRPAGGFASGPSLKCTSFWAIEYSLDRWI